MGEGNCVSHLMQSRCVGLELRFSLPLHRRLSFAKTQFVCVFNNSNTTSITRTWRLIREETNLPSQHAINEPVKVSGVCARDSNKFHRLKLHSSVQYDARTMFLCSCLPGCSIIGWDSNLTV